LIAVDTSALMAIVLAEADAASCADSLEHADRILISAATLSEALIVARHRHVGARMNELLDGLGLEVVNVTSLVARRVAAAYAAWGKGAHPAGLNWGDCFSYDVAKSHNCALLFVGQDFSRTDLKRIKP